MIVGMALRYRFCHLDEVDFKAFAIVPEKPNSESFEPMLEKNYCFCCKNPASAVILMVK